MLIRVCVNAEPGTAHAKRPAPHPGPRCATCHRETRAARRKAAHGAHVTRTRGITAEEYAELYRAQGGRCAVCGPWTGRSGKRRALAVDHDHRTGEVRGLLCSTCNRIIGLFRDNWRVFHRAALYLLDPPARKVLAARDWRPYR